MADLGTIYESSLSRSDRRRRGVYYTPTSIVHDLFTTIEPRCTTFCDPFCGGGNMLLGAVEAGFAVENIYGYDLDPEAVRISRERIFEATGYDASANIVCADFFDLDATLRYDCVVTNPPWGSYLDDERRVALSTRYGLPRRSDVSAFAVMGLLEMTRKGGTLAALLPESFFNIGTFEDARRKLLNYNIIHLRDYGRPFKGLLTRAQSVTLINQEVEGCVECRYDGVVSHRPTSQFKRNPKSIINLWLSAEGAEAIDAIYLKPHVTLRDNARWGMGIVTGDNAKYCHTTPEAGDVAVVRGYNLTREGLTPCDTYIPADMSGYQQVAPRDIYLAREKILYRFITNRVQFYHDRKQRYMLNSVNAVIPSEELGLSCAEVVRRLNSPLIGWLYGALFRSHKILRRDLEQLPLHTAFWSDQERALCDYFGIEATSEGGYKIKK